jgi:bifunctional enzyme CysN/CysC
LRRLDDEMPPVTAGPPSSGQSRAEAAETAVRTGPAERMHLVVTGHVDHGKSTILGRLLADTGSLPEGKLDAVRLTCERNAKPFEYAFLLDALRDEQAQGITIDSARVFFRTPRRNYVIIDAPGHIEFLKNMITGASRAEAALLVIDAQEGIRENSRRHGFMLSMLGIGQIAVLVNKMDLVDYSREVFDRVVDEYGRFLARFGVTPVWFIPVSGVTGENVAATASNLAWYRGPTVLEALEGFESRPLPASAPFRMPVQGVYKFTQHNDTRRIVAGTVESGRIRVGDEVIFYPSGKKSRIDTIEAFNRPAGAEASAGEATGFTLADQIYIGRGELAAVASQPKPHVTTRMKVSLFWLGKAPLVLRKEYQLKLGTGRVPFRLEQIHRVIDASELSMSETPPAQVERHEVAECTLALGKPLAFDTAEGCPSTGRFVIVDDFEISGGGIVREALPDKQAWVREKVLNRNYKWEPGSVSAERRMERYSQRPVLLVITGEKEADRKRLARELEGRLFEEGRHVYFLGIGNVLYGVDADIERTGVNRLEHLRRLGEVANILLDAGLIVIATAVALTQEDIEVIRTSGGSDRVVPVWLGDRMTTDLACDLVLTPQEAEADGAGRLKELLLDSGAIFRPW